MSAHLAVPFRIRGAYALTVADGSMAEMVQNVGVICATRRGQRLSRPDFGITDPSFATDINETEIEEAVRLYEDRVEVEVTASPTTRGREAAVTVAVFERRVS